MVSVDSVDSVDTVKSMKLELMITMMIIYVDDKVNDLDKDNLCQW